MCKSSCNSYRQPSLQSPTALQSLKTGTSYLFFYETNSDLLCFQQTSQINSPNLLHFRALEVRKPANSATPDSLNCARSRPARHHNRSAQWTRDRNIPRRPDPRANGLDGCTAVVRGRFPCARLYSECSVLARRLGHHNRRELNYKWKLVETALGRSSRPEPSAFRRTPMRARSGAWRRSRAASRRENGFRSTGRPCNRPARSCSGRTPVY